MPTRAQQSTTNWIAVATMSSKYDSFRSILDQLMGGDRDLRPEEKTGRKMHFSDAKVCKYFICGLCPHELFTNTKSDLGPCPNLHDDEIKAEYDKLSPEEKWRSYPFEREFMSKMQKMVSDLDKRIDRGHKRLALQDAENPVSQEQMEKIDAISEQMELLLRQMEDLGAAGRLSEAQALELQILKLKAEQEAIKKGVTNLPPGVAPPPIQQEKRLQVCEICGAFLVVGDTEDRIKSHNDGKQHMGYLAIRTILDEKKRLMGFDDERGRPGGPIIRDHRGLDRREPYPSSSRRRDSRGDYRDGRSSGDYRDRDRDRYRNRGDRRDHRDRDRGRDRDQDRGHRDKDRDGGRKRHDDDDDDDEGEYRDRSSRKDGPSDSH